MSFDHECVSASLDRAKLVQREAARILAESGYRPSAGEEVFAEVPTEAILDALGKAAESLEASYYVITDAEIFAAANEMSGGNDTGSETDDHGEDGEGGVREPREPGPSAGSGEVALPEPGSHKIDSLYF